MKNAIKDKCNTTVIKTKPHQAKYKYLNICFEKSSNTRVMTTRANYKQLEQTGGTRLNIGSEGLLKITNSEIRIGRQGNAPSIKDSRQSGEIERILKTND